MAEQVTPQDLVRLFRWGKVALALNGLLTLVNAGVLYALMVFVVAEPASVDGVDPFTDEELAAEAERGDAKDPVKYRKELRDFFDRMTDLLDRAARKHGTNPADVLPDPELVNKAVESLTMHSDESQEVMQKLREGFDYYDLPWPTVIPEK